uniref:FAST kinase domains 2 n=1 Tax=Kryptolebias marmoratus TaxID=37003 RepID=A0A3Q3BAC0_KRYMA
MRWSLRLCGRFLWKQHRFLATASFKDSYVPTHQRARFWGSKHYQKSLSSSLVRIERYHSQGENHNEELEENSCPSSQLLELSSTGEVQLDEMASGLKPKISPFTICLRQCRSPSDVLDLTCKYSPTVQQISNCLTCMWSSLKTMSDDQQRYELQLMFQHPEFENFLQTAMMSVQRMRNDSIAYSVLSMISMGVPQRSRVVQTFLQACQEKLNDFDEKSLSILASCLEQMEDSPNVDALKEGMRLIVTAQLPEINNVKVLQILMRILGKDAPKELKLKLERKALSMTDQFSIPNAQHMISAMDKMGFRSKPLLHACSQKITENLHCIPFNRLFTVLQSCRNLNYRDLDLLTGVSDHVSSTFDIWTNKQLLLFLSLFENFLYCPGPLMKAYAEKVIENPDALTLKDLLCVLKVYSSLNFDLEHQRQPFLESISEALGSYLPKVHWSTLVKAVYFLCALNHFPSAVLEHLLQPSVLEDNLKVRDKMFWRLDICLRLDRPPLPRPLSVPASLLEQPTSGGRAVNLRLSTSLQSLQANTELQEMMVVENFYPTNDFLGFLRIAVIYAKNSSFCYGTSDPRGSLAVKLRHLKILGYTPVLVTDQDLQSESEEKRTELLRRRIFPEHASETQPKLEHLES